MNQPRLTALSRQTVAISRCDRWQAHQRLRDLGISCSCSGDGALQVEINSVVEACQLRSVVQQLTAPRHQLVDWLEACWLLKS
jgi:hypothetical protein